MSKNLAPIVLFVYNRPIHTQKTIEALIENKFSIDSDLIIYSDAPRNESSAEKVKEVRNYIKTVKGFKSITILEREKNLGLAASIIDGVTSVVNRHGKIIVLEDDLVTSPFFLSFMNKGLDLYEEENEVISIHGYNYPVVLETKRKTFFLKGADCWGWATWKRGWDLFESNGQYLLDTIIKNKQSSEFNFNDSYPYLQMLKDQIRGKNDSWAIRWYASAFIKNKLTVYPVKSLVQNIGLDLSGSHSGLEVQYENRVLSTETFSSFESIGIEEDQEAKRVIEIFFKKSGKISFIKRVIRYFKDE